MPLVLGPLIIGLLPFLAALVLIGLSKASTSAHGSSDTGSFFDFITGKAYLHQLSGFSAKFARWIVSRFAAGQLVMLARWFTGMGTLTIGWFTGNALFSEAIVAAVERVMHRGDPKARSKASTANRHAVHAGHAAAHANTHARSVGHAFDHYKARTNTRLHHLTHQTTVALPRDIARVKHRERWAERQLWKVRDRAKSLEDGAIKTWEWIKDHPEGAITGAFAGAVSIALGRLGLDSIRCPSLRNTYNKRGCGMWSDLDALLGIFAAAELALHVEDVVKIIEELSGPAVSLLDKAK